MNYRIKLRVIALGTAIALIGLAIGLMTVRSQRQAAELRQRLTQVDSESFRIADQFGDYLRRLNNSLFRYGVGRAPADLDKFRVASDELNSWIDEQKPKLRTATEIAAMQQIDSAYDDYLRVANELLTKLAALGAERATLADYAPFLEESRRLFDLGQALAKAHYESRASAVAEVNQAINEEHALLLICLSGLFVFGLVLAVVVYRDLIAPLRVQLVESQALVERQEKLASLGMLAAGIAHEIRNPLTAIKAALFIQQKKFEPGSPEFADARVVEREILRLEKIVNDFLLFARPSEPELADVSAGSLLQEVHTLLAPQLAKNRIQLRLEPPPPVRVRADAAQIKQVLINLVQNAADAIGQEGTIRLRARRERRRLAQKDASAVILEVEDTGKGIPPEVQKRLFDPFFTTKESGTGLGLSIAAGIVQKHGGVLEYRTLAGHGTTFGIVLPGAVGETGPRAD
jgi:signal transduction histidine kinase